MGLDMYLEAEHYVGGGWEHARKSGGEDATRFDAILSAFGTDYGKHRERYPEGNYIQVAFEVAYWRKANAVHAWFVKHVQGGKDDCQRSYVSRELLAELREVCQKILATTVMGDAVKEQDGFSGHDYDAHPNVSLDTNLANSLLPPQSGFFFGGTDLRPVVRPRSGADDQATRRAPRRPRLAGRGVLLSRVLVTEPPNTRPTGRVEE